MIKFKIRIIFMFYFINKMCTHIDNRMREVVMQLLLPERPLLPIESWVFRFLNPVTQSRTNMKYNE